MVRTYTCRLYPSRAQAAELRTRLDAACERYNATLRELYEAWAEQDCTSGERVATDLVLRADQTAIPSASGDDVVHRAQQAFGAFLLKCQQHGSAPGGLPLPTRQHFVSLTFVDWCSATPGGLDLPGVGPVAVNKRRVLPVHPTAVTVKHRGQIWQACFNVKAD